MNCTRRDFLHRTAGATAAGAAGSALLWQSPAALADDKPGTGGPKRLAVVTTIYRTNSHADHIAGRFLTGYTINGRHHQPSHKVVSMHVEQVGANDLSRGLAKRHGFELFPTIREALCVGSDSLNVDAVLYIGEHGNYPVNDLGQTLYPRHRMLSEVVAEFRRSGRSVPVFNDKHLSYSWEKALELYNWSQELGFPLQAGSSLPVTWRRPELELPLETPVEEAMAVAFSDKERYGFHALETLQCHIERRLGGETGLASVESFQGDAVWQAAERGAWSPELFDAATGASRTLRPGPVQHNAANPVAYQLTFRDGLKATVLMLTGHVADFNFAAKLKGQKEPVATCHVLPNPPGAKYFDALTWNIERMFDSGRAVIPIKRTLFTSGVLEAALKSLKAGRPLETPHLDVTYKAHVQSGFFRGGVSANLQRKG